jgi:NADH-quinone oxidoreductase subunit G
LFVEGRGHKEEINIFPGKPCNNKLAGNVVDLCPVGALLDKDFLFKQRVWLLQSTPSVSPVDSGGENIFLDHNEGVVYRIRPRQNLAVNQWWISDDTRYSYKALTDEHRIKKAMQRELGALTPTTFAKAVAAATAGLKAAFAGGGEGSLYAVLSPMMACEEAWLLGKYIRSLDPQALLVLGPVPSSGENEVFKHAQTGKQTFVIQAEKVPNSKGVRRVMGLLGGPTAEFGELNSHGQAGKLAGGWIVGGYLSPWMPANVPAVLGKGFRVLQDLIHTEFAGSVDVVLPAAAWAEKDGCWENFAGIIQPFMAGVVPPEGVRREGDVYLSLLGEGGLYNAEAVRTQMGQPFAELKLPSDEATAPAFEFAEL